jgi:hypothetical protein
MSQSVELSHALPPFPQTAVNETVNKAQAAESGSVPPRFVIYWYRYWNVVDIGVDVDFDIDFHRIHWCVHDMYE